MRALLTVMMAGVLLGGVLVDTAGAGDKREKHRRGDARYSRDYRDDDRDYRRYRSDRYVRGRDIVVIRDYYRP